MMLGEAVRACVWVDEVIPKSPYIMTPEYIQNVSILFALVVVTGYHRYYSMSIKLII